ncbi:hypothetical protein Bca4012_039647 [Brassica carinata]
MPDFAKEVFQRQAVWRRVVVFGHLCWDKHTRNVCKSCVFGHLKACEKEISLELIHTKDQGEFRKLTKIGS